MLNTFKRFFKFAISKTRLESVSRLHMSSLTEVQLRRIHQSGKAGFQNLLMVSRFLERSFPEKIMEKEQNFHWLYPGNKRKS